MRGQKLSLNERLSLVLATLALVVSMVTFYWQSLRSAPELAVTVVAPVVGPKSFSFEFAFFNTGNKAVLIDSACVVTTTAELGRNTGSCWSEQRPDGLPAILEPGKILKAKIERESYSWQQMYETGTHAIGPLRKQAGWKQIPIGLQLVVFDADGIRREKTTEPMFSFHAHSDGSTSNPTTEYRSVSLRW